MLTSYFANIKNLKYPIAICRGVPKWYNGPVFQDLAPSWATLNAYKNSTNKAEAEQQYIKEFLQDLDKLNATDIVAQLSKVYDVNIDEVCLICYEKPSDFCHRHLVANWLKNNGYKCEEIRPGIKQS